MPLTNKPTDRLRSRLLTGRSPGHHYTGLYICLFLILSSNLSFSQPKNRIDSLKKLIGHLPANQYVKKTQNLLKLGTQYENVSDYTSALDCYQESLTIAQEINSDSLIAHSYRSLAAIAFSQGDVTKDSIYIFQALTIYRKINDKLNEALCLKRIGASYVKRGKMPDAKKYLEKALAVFKQVNQQQMIASVYSNLAVVYQGDYRKAIELELAAKKIWDKYPPENDKAIITTGNLGVDYFYMVRFHALKSVKHDAIIPADSASNLKKADTYIRAAIQMAKHHKDFENLAYFSEILSELQFHNGDYKNAYLNYFLYQTINDSIFSQQNKNKIAELENKNVLDTKNREIETQRLHVREQERNIILLISGLVTLFIIGTLFYRLSIVRKQKNAELTRLNEQLDNANKTKAKFFAILTHDLRSPIANLINFLQLQKRHPELLNEEQKADQEKKITGSALSLLNVMEEILLWSKGQMESFKPQKKNVPVSDLFSYLKDFFSAVSDIDFHYSDDETLTVYTDENYLKTIMHNLTQNSVNALKNVPDASVTWKVWADGELLKLSITDNGKGMNAEQEKKFHENSPVSSAKQGLGLHLIKDMTQIIGCTLVLESSESTGTTFTLIIAHKPSDKN